MLHVEVAIIMTFTRAYYNIYVKAQFQFIIIIIISSNITDLTLIVCFVNCPSPPLSRLSTTDIHVLE